MIKIYLGLIVFAVAFVVHRCCHEFEMDNCITI